MSVTLTEKQAEALTRVMDRHERHHFDGVCTSNGLQYDCETCGDIAFVRDALTREPATSASACQHRELLERAARAIEAMIVPCDCKEPCGCGAETDRKAVELVGEIDTALSLSQPCAAPGEAGEWDEVARGTPNHDCVPPVEIENAMKAGVEHVVYRRRAPEREGGDPDVR